MKGIVLGLSFLLLGAPGSYAQQKSGSAAPAKNVLAEQQIKKLSKDKWRWMAERKADTLAVLFDDQAMFVHMGGSWGKKQELDVIRSGSIHYKQADVEETSVQIIENTAILLSKIRLLAVVGGNEVTNPFIVTEVYVREKGKWKLGSLSFTRLLTP
ncbi:nuclear transport factor 2 family protein [Hymenobacter sp. AT01-02]|uniref:nuclear transport factor 2 family protein n=1 Tax=Hymenobacter sp. AT01-02 TaxID=1571877 RepID=UPI0005F264DF|nr:nuclear transport factor 2 family protein [Hymenobacter sp. AT01-02]